MSTVVTTTNWSGQCKDCGRRGDEGTFVYPESWIRSLTERGGSKSDRCPACRKLHSRAVRAMAVPYLDIDAIGQVVNQAEPQGPLGGLGALPGAHSRLETESDYSRFDFGLDDDDVQRLLAGLRHKQVAVVTAGTGSGKSTFLPYRLLLPPSDTDLRLTDIGPIVVTEPRKLAAIECATFVAKQLMGSPHVGAGCDVGYRVKGREAFDAACRLLYVTDGSLINWLRDGSYERFSTIVIDEAHERSRNIDVILGALRVVLPKHPRLRVVIASATIDADAFVSFFGDEDHVVRLDVEAQKEWGYGRPLWPGVPVDVSHPDWIAEDGSPRRYRGWSLPEMTLRVAEARVREDPMPFEQWRQRMPAQVAKQVIALVRGTEWGDVLAFLPTRPLIEECAGAIRRALSPEEASVYELLASTPQAQQRAALTVPPEDGPRRVIISTNVAETSMTIDGVTFVVDSGLICQKRWTTETASASYPALPHSQAGVRQRWGRVGRKSPGWVLPLYTHEQYAQLPEHTPPETVRDNLEAYVLTAKAVGVDDPLELPSITLHTADISEGDHDRAHGEQYQREIARALGALSARGHVDDEGDVTHAGAELLAYSGDPGEAGAMILADELACAVEAATAIVLLGGGRPLVGGLLRFSPKWPVAARDAAFRSYETLTDGCRDDLDAALRLWAAWESASDVKDFCDRHFLDAATLRAAVRLRKEKLEFLSPGRRSALDQPVRAELADRVRVVFARAYADLTFVDDGSGWRPASGEPRPGGYLLGRHVQGGGSGRIVALGRNVTLAGAKGPAYLSGVVDVEEWPLAAVDLNTLVRACAARLRGSDGRLRGDRDDMPARLRQMPIGSRWRVSVSRTEGIEGEADVIARLPDAPSAASVIAVEADIEVPAGSNDDLVPDEELGELLSLNDERIETVLGEAEETFVDLEELESAASDDVAPEGPAAPTTGDVESSDLVGSVVSMLWSGRPPAEEPTVLQVVGYRDARPVVRADAEHGLLAAACAAGAAPGQAITVEAAELVTGWGRSYLVAHDVASGCPVFLDAADLTFSRYDHAIAEQVPIGSEMTLTVEAVDVTPGLLRASRLPQVARDLRRLRVAVAGGQEWHEAVITGESWRAGDAVVSLQGGDPASGLLHRFSVPAWLLQRNAIEPAEGLLVQVRLTAEGLERGERQLSKRYKFVPEGLEEVVRNERDLAWDGLGQRLTVLQPLTVGTRDRLAELSDKPAWKSAMQRLWRESNLVVVRGVKPSLAARRAQVEAARRDRPPGTTVEATVEEVRPNTVVLSFDGIRGQAHRREVGSGSEDLARVFSVGASVHAQIKEIRLGTDERALYDLTIPASSVQVPIGAHLEEPMKRGFARARVSRPGVAVTVLAGPMVRLTGMDRDALALAAAEVSRVDALPALSIRLAVAKMGIVIGRGGATIKQLSAIAGVHHLSAEDDGRLIVIADDEPTLKRLVASVRELVTETEGTLVLPPGKNGVLIGRQGATIKDLLVRSGCTSANALNRTETWKLKAADAAAIHVFADLAAQHVPGATLTETKASGIIEIDRLRG